MQELNRLCVFEGLWGGVDRTDRTDRVDGHGRARTDMDGHGRCGRVELSCLRWLKLVYSRFFGTLWRIQSLHGGFVLPGQSYPISLTIFQKLALLGVAGALGTVSRYSLASLAHSITGVNYPLGTLLVNILGCFLAGLVCSIADSRAGLSNEARLVMLVGFMGAFTTFSAFIVDTGNLFKEARYLAAGLNIFAQNMVGLIGMFSGLWIGRFWPGVDT